MLGLDQTPWSERGLKDQKEGKKIGKEGRSKAGANRISGTKLSHPLTDFVGQYENPAYGIINITQIDTALQFDFHKMILPLKHFHYDRFDTPDDEQFGLFSLNFTTNPQGHIEGLFVSLDESQTTFTKKADAKLSDPAILLKYAGKYTIAGSFISVELIDKALYLVPPGSPRYQLIPVKSNSFRVKEFPDMSFVFVLENSEVTGFKRIDPSHHHWTGTIKLVKGKK